MKRSRHFLLLAIALGAAMSAQAAFQWTVPPLAGIGTDSFYMLIGP